MKLVVGLGNPGQKYEMTRHNLGFMLIDRLFEKAGAYRFRDEANAWVALVGSNAPVQDVRLGEAAAIVQPAFGQGATAQLHLHLAQQTIGSLIATVYIAGSSSSEADARAAYERLQTEHDPLVRDKQDLLAMSALNLLATQQNIPKKSPELESEINQLDLFVSDYLQKESNP